MKEVKQDLLRAEMLWMTLDEKVRTSIREKRHWFMEEKKANTFGHITVMSSYFILLSCMLLISVISVDNLVVFILQLLSRCSRCSDCLRHRKTLDVRERGTLVERVTRPRWQQHRHHDDRKQDGFETFASSFNWRGKSVFRFQFYSMISLLSLDLIRWSLVLNLIFFLRKYFWKSAKMFSEILRCPTDTLHPLILPKYLLKYDSRHALVQGMTDILQPCLGFGCVPVWMRLCQVGSTRQ